MKSNFKRHNNSLTRIVTGCLLFLGICGTLLFIFTPYAYAADCNGTKTSIINCEKTTDGKDIDGVWSIVLTAINILTAGVGIAAVGGIVYGAIMYTSAGDNDSQVAKAKEIIRNTIIGIIAFIAMYSFLQFIVPGGIFGSDSPLIASKKVPYKKPASVPNSSSAGAPKASDQYSSPTGGSCYTVGNQSGKNVQGRQFHKFGSLTYAFENSPQGIRYAANHNYNSIDLDIRVTKDGQLVAEHWGRPSQDGYNVGSNARVENMTYAQLSRLRNKDGTSKIYTLRELIDVAKRNNVNLALEMKNAKAMRPRLTEIASMLNAAQVKGFIKGAARNAGMNQTLATARKLGFWTRGTLGSQGWRAPEPNNKCK